LNVITDSAACSNILNMPMIASRGVHGARA
jgi:hypothetical protein